MTKDEKIKRIESISPETAIHDLLGELLPEMGYDDVNITHERGNRPENGKDIIASLYDKIENIKDWTAFVVKKGDISGTSTSIREVQDQVNDCFQYEYKNVIDKLRIRISKVKVVCSGKISGGAQEKILQNNNFDKANIGFWDKNKLVRFIDQKYPSYWIEGSKVYKEYIDKLAEIIEKDSKLKAIGTSDDKIHKVLECVVSPRITERIESEDGGVQYKPRELTYLTTLEGIVFITGDAGTGKTTLLKSISKFIIEQNSLRNHTEFYPVLIDAIDIKLSSNNVVKTLRNYFKQDWNRNLIIKVEDLINSNNTILFIDAIDEIADEDQRNDVLESILEFSVNYPKIKIVCTSRPISIFEETIVSDKFKHFTLENLNIRQVNEFINNYFGENEIKSERLRKSLNESGILEKLPKTPLSLALITILYDDTEIEIPATITDLYSHFTDILLEKNQIKKAIDIIDFSIKHRIISLLAFELHYNKTDRVSQKDFKILIDKYNKNRNREVDSTSIVELLTQKSGILYKSKSGNISFKHLSFQEYFTAYEYFHYRKTEEDFLVKNFNNEWWQNVSIFFGGMNKDAPDFLDKISSQSVSSDFRINMLYVSGMGKLLQAVYNTPEKNKLNGLNSSIKNVDAVIEFINTATVDFSDQFISYFSRIALNQIIYFYFATSHNSITLQDTFIKLYNDLSSDLKDSKKGPNVLSIERKLFGIVLAIIMIDKENLHLLAEFTKNRKSDDELLTTSAYTFFKLEFDSLPKYMKKLERMKKLNRTMKKSIKHLRLSDELTKSLKSRSKQDENNDEEE